MVAPSFSLVAHRSVIAVGGPDRVDFLQGLISKVTVEDCSAAMEVAVVFGRDAEKALPIEGVTAFVDTRLPGLGVRVLAPAGRAATLLAARGCTEAPLAAYDVLRLELGDRKSTRLNS